MNEHMPSISVIIPVYNKEKYLSRCIESVLGQTFDDLEVLLIDDGSTDGSLDVCRKYEKMDGRVRVFHKENGGLSHTRNFGLEHARGEYVAFVDADDWLDETMYQQLHEMIRRYEADIASVSYVLANDKTVIHKKPYGPKVFETEDALAYYLYTGLAKKVQDYPVWIKLYKKWLFEDVKFPEKQLYEDMITNTRLLCKAKRYVKSEEPLYYYYQGEGSIIRNKLKMGDFDFYKTNRAIREIIYDKNYIKLFGLADAIYARSPMSLLIKACIYGIDSSIEDPKEIMEYLKKDLRKHAKVIFKSPLPVSRKVATAMLCLGAGGIKRGMDIYRGN